MPVNCAEAFRRQRGVSLIEAMIGTLLLSIVFLGLSFALSRTLVAQRHLNAQSLAVMELRELTAATGLGDLCSAGSGAIAVGQHQVGVQVADCTSPAITVSAGGFSATLAGGELPGVGASVSTVGDATSRDYFGGNGVITFSYQ